MVRSLKSKGKNTNKNTFSVLSNKSKRNQRGFLKKNSRKVFRGKKLIGGKKFGSEQMLMSIESKDEINLEEIALSTSNEYIVMTPERTCTQNYSNIQPLQNEDYGVLVEQLSKSISGVNNSLVESHFKNTNRDLDYVRRCYLEISPWEAEDLEALHEKIKETVVKDGLKWSEGCKLVEVGYGVKKMVLTAVLKNNLDMDAIIEEMADEDEGTFKEEIQGFSMTKMEVINKSDNLRDIFLETYGSDVYFFMDPLLNDIDDCIAFLYFFHLTLETFKDDINQEINLYLNLRDVEDIKEKRFPICKSVANKLVEYCNLVNKSKIKVTISEKDSPEQEGEKKKKATIFLIRGMSDKSLLSLEELEEKFESIMIIANGADIFSHETASCPSNVRCGSKIYDGSNRQKIFNDYLNFIDYIKDTNDRSCKVTFKCFPLARKERPFTFKVGQNGMIDENNTVSVTTSTTGLDELQTHLKDIRTKLNSVEKNLPSLKFEDLCDLYKQGKGDYKYKVFQDKNLQKLQKTELKFGDIIFPNVSHAIIDPEDCEAYSNYGSFLIDWLAIMSCPSSKDIAAKRTLIRFLETDNQAADTIIKAQEQQNKRIRFDFKDIIEAKAVLEELLEHSENVEDLCFLTGNGKYETQTEKKFTKLLSKTPATLIQPVEGMKFEKLNPHGKVSMVDKIHPQNAILSRVAKTFKTPVRNTLSLKEEDDCKRKIPLLFGNVLKKIFVQIGCQEGPQFRLPEKQLLVNKDDKPSLGVMSDNNRLFLDKSAGPNGILLLGSDYGGGNEYGQNRMNTVFKTVEETKYLVDKFIEFRNKHKQDIFNMWLKALKSVSSLESEYQKTLSNLFGFYEWCDLNEISLFEVHAEHDVQTPSTPPPTSPTTKDPCLNLMSTCQTWMRVLPTNFKSDSQDKEKFYMTQISEDSQPSSNQTPSKVKYNFMAHNTVPIPHFQTFPYIQNEDLFKKLYNKYLSGEKGKTIAKWNEFKEGFISLINFFTRSMVGDYGTTYPVSVTKEGSVIGTSVPDVDYNGNGFLILDTFSEFLGEQKGGTCKKSKQKIRRNRKRTSLRKLKGESKKIEVKKFNQRLKK